MYNFLLMCFCLLCGLLRADPINTVDAIKQRGYLKCGVSTGLPGFSYIDADGRWQGFDVDFCRAVAAAILNDSEQVSYVPLDARSRFAALAAREIDVLIRVTTWNFTREATLNVLFPGVIFYDGQSVLVRKSLGVKRIDELETASICVTQGTTSEINLSSYFDSKRKTFKPVYFDRSEQLVRSYEAGRCDAISSDRSQLFVLRSILSRPEDHVILDETISKEPLSPVVRDDDVLFFKLMRWIIFAMIQAEEWGLTRDNMYAQSEAHPDIKQFLGRARNIAPALGVSQTFVAQILDQVGHYGDVYEKNFGAKSAITVPRGKNALWQQGCGLMYAMPSR